MRYLLIALFALLALPASAHEPYEHMYKAEVVRIIDGDTIVVNIDLGLGLVHHKEAIRLYGVNTPEMNTQDGKDVKKLVEAMIPVGSTITLETINDKRGKFGRVLGIIYIPGRIEGPSDVPYGKQLNLWLLGEGHAVPFMAETIKLMNRGRRK